MTQRSYKPKAAFFDLDGTLAIYNQPPSQEDVRAIRDFRARGNKAFLNTGRSMGFVYPSILQIGFDGIVAGAGAYIRMGDKLLQRRRIPPQALDRVIRYFSQAKELCVLEGEVAMYQVGWSEARSFHWPRVNSYRELVRRFPNQAVTKLTFFVSMNEAIRQVLGPDFSVIEHGDYVEALPAGCSKSTGMRLVLDALQIDRQDSIAFGDSMNDYDMIQYAGIGVAMGNAVEPVKVAADRVTLPFDQGGVAQALREMMGTDGFIQL